jgi:acyl carrier protein
MGKVIALEHPELNCVRVDLDPEVDSNAQALFEEINSKTPEDQIAFRDNVRYVARLARSAPKQAQSVTLRRDATYLITGGLGVLGLRVAQWMIEQGAQHLVLTGRRGASSQVQDILTQMEQTGAQIIVARADVSQAADIAKVLTDIKASMPPLQGIVHAAGVPGFQTLEKLEWNTFESVLRPKVLGTWVLHQLTQEMNLDFFVNFSSISSVWGSKGQSHYVAANHFLDIWSHYRRGLGLPALSINWGPWAGGGMMTTEVQSGLAHQGIKLLPPELAIGALEYLLGTECVQITVAQVDWNIFKPLYEVTGTRSLLEKMTEVPTETDVAKSTTILQHLENASAKERWEWVISYLQQEVANVLGFPPSQLPDLQQGFAQMGIDSLMAVDLRNRLQTKLGRSMPSTLAFDYPNIESLAGYVFNEVFGSEKPTKKHAPQKSDDELTKNITQLSERDLEALIDGKLGALG